jgi:outer membrane protein TolC
MVRSERAKLDVDLVRAYYGVAVNRTLVELAGRTIEQLDRKCRTMSNFLAVGSATELDVMRARVMRSSWGVNLASMTRAYEANLSRLSALTGLAKSDLVVTNTLIPLPAPLAESVAEARTRALASRPELVMAENSSRIAEASRRIRASGLFPQASASWNGYWSAKKETPALSGNDWKTWWDLRLSVTWEFFNLGRWAELDQSRHEVNARAEDLQASRDRIAAEAEDAWRGLDEARKSWEASEQNLELARMTARTASSRKKSGAITETEELESLLGETEASVQKLRSEYDLAVAYAEFNRATGRE